MHTEALRVLSIHKKSFSLGILDSVANFGYIFGKKILWFLEIKELQFDTVSFHKNARNYVIWQKKAWFFQKCVLTFSVSEWLIYFLILCSWLHWRINWMMVETHGNEIINTLIFKRNKPKWVAQTPKLNAPNGILQLNVILN